MLAGLPALAACSVLPDRPFIPTERFTLAPERPGRRSGPGRKVLLVRLLRAAPGLEQRGLRTVNGDGTEATDFYAEWAAPPAEAAEEALRRWLAASGLFAAVTAPGSRARADLVLEAELAALHADLGRREARATLAALLLQDAGLGGRVLAQLTPTGTAPLVGAEPPAAARAAAMVAALGAALAALEAGLRRFA